MLVKIEYSYEAPRQSRDANKFLDPSLRKLEEFNSNNGHTLEVRITALCK